MASLGSLISPGWARGWSCFETGEINLVGTGEGTQWIKRLLSQHKDLSPDPQHLHKSCVEDVPPALGDREVDGSWGLAGQ